MVQGRLADLSDILMRGIREEANVADRNEKERLRNELMKLKEQQDLQIKQTRERYKNDTLKTNVRVGAVEYFFKRRMARKTREICSESGLSLRIGARILGGGCEQLTRNYIFQSLSLF